MRVGPLLELMADWRSFIEEDITREEIDCFRLHERRGRLLGDEAFLERMERMEKMACRLLRRR